MSAPFRCAVARIEPGRRGPETAVYDDPNHPAVTLREIRSRVGDRILVGLVPLCELHTDPDAIALEDYVTRRWLS